MSRKTTFLSLLAILFLCSCSRKEETGLPAATTEAAKPAGDASKAEASPAPRVLVHLKNGSTVPGTIVASSRNDMVVAGDDGIEHKIPLAQVKSVEYPSAESSAPGGQPPRPSALSARRDEPATPRRPAAERPSQPAPERPAETAAAPRAITTRTYELPAGSEISVRMNEPIDSQTAAEGQTFDAQVTRDAKDANGDVVIPRGSSARVVIKSASSGGRIRGASDLVLDLQSVTANGKQYAIDTVEVARKGKSGVGLNRRTAEYTGGGAALGAIIGAIAGGGKGAAIGAGAGAGAGALTQVLTKGRAIKVPAESVLTFNLDKSLKVTQVE